MPRISWAKKNQLIWEIQQQYRTLITYYFTGWVCEYSLHLSHTYIQEWAESFFHETSSEKLSMALSVFLKMYSLLCDLPNRLSWMKPFLHHQRYTVNSLTYLSFFFFLLLLLLLLLLSNFSIFFRYSVSHHESVLANLRWALSLAVLTDKLAAGPNYGRNADWLFSSAGLTLSQLGL